MLYFARLESVSILPVKLVGFTPC